MNFQSSLVKPDFIAAEDPTECDVLNNLHFLPEDFDKHRNTDNSDNQDVMQLIDSFWNSKHHVSRNISDTLLQGLAQNLNVVEKFLFHF